MWLYDLPLIAGLPLFVILVVAGSCAILIVLRRWVSRAAGASGEWDRVLTYAVTAYGVFYGVTLGLIAAGAYGNFAEVDGVVLSESSSLAVLYRDATFFSEPSAGDLRAAVTQYAERVIDEDWPLQQRLIQPETTDDAVTAIEAVIAQIEPSTTHETVSLAETMGVFNEFVENRRERISLTHLALPGVLWIVLAVGAVLNAVLIGLIEVKNLRIHLIMAALIALFVALLLYAVAGFDHAYAGPIAVGPDYFRELLDGLFSGAP